MKIIKDNKVYNTKTSKHISDNYFGHVDDSDHLHYDLYKTKKGTYFMIVKGGPNSKMSFQTEENESVGCTHFFVLTVDEAMEWCEEHLDAENYLKEFSEYVEEA